MISVIIPIYNVEKYLAKCIESVCNQTYKDIEIILVDDGSTDGSYEICEAYKEKDSRIVVIHKQNGGSTSARKVGTEAARGEYIGYLDGDDWIEPDMYEKMLCTLESEKVSIVMAGRYEDTGKISRRVCHGIAAGRYDKNKLVIDVYSRMIVNNEFFEWGIFPGLWDKLFRRDCIYAQQMAVDERIAMGDDAACVYPALLDADSIYIMDDCFYHYRQNTDTMVKQRGNAYRERMQFKVLYDFVMREMEKRAGIFDCRKQWQQYVLFLMTARADSLYAGYESLDYLFPYSNVKKGSSIVIYGAGTYGQRLHGYLKKSGFCKIVAWVDRNYEELRKMGLQVDSPEKITESKFDYIVIAITFAKARKELYVLLSEKYGKARVAMIDEELIMSDETLMRFGLGGA